MDKSKHFLLKWFFNFTLRTYMLIIISNNPKLQLFPRVVSYPCFSPLPTEVNLALTTDSNETRPRVKSEVLKKGKFGLRRLAILKVYAAHL